MAVYPIPREKAGGAFLKFVYKIMAKEKGRCAGDPVHNNRRDKVQIQTIPNKNGADNDRFRRSKTEFGKQLNWLSKEVPDGSVLMTITPLMAEEILSRNEKNRPKSASTVKKYAEEMRSGRWVQTGIPLVFSKSGSLLDGQHRVAAIIENGSPQSFYCVFGVEDAAFAFIDQGKKRTASDIFAIHGVPHYTAMSAAVRWVWAYETKRMYYGYSGLAGGVTLSPDQLYDVYLKHERLQESVPIARTFAVSRLAAPSLMVGLHYLCACKSRQQADDFFLKVGDGVGFTNKTEPAYRLHRFLTDNVMSSRPVRGVHVAAITINAWNAQRQARSRFSTVAETGKAFPRIV